MHAQYRNRECFHRKSVSFLNPDKVIFLFFFLPQKTITLSVIHSTNTPPTQCALSSIPFSDQPWATGVCWEQRQLGHSNARCSGLQPGASTPSPPSWAPTAGCWELTHRGKNNAVLSDIPQGEHGGSDSLGAGRRKESEVESFFSVKFNRWKEIVSFASLWETQWVSVPGGVAKSAQLSTYSPLPPPPPKTQAVGLAAF